MESYNGKPKIFYSIFKPVELGFTVEDRLPGKNHILRKFQIQPVGNDADSVSLLC